MKQRYVSSFFFASLLITAVGCSGPSGSSLSRGSTLSGVAATGAPISGGAVGVKGADGDIAEGTTNSDGTYSIDIGALTGPFLIRVISPTGEKYISVASQSDLAAGKKVNITPLTHTIVANVFGNSDADELFENFESESSEFTEEKLDDEKDELVQKFVAAGLLGSGKIAGSDIDLMNGAFVAGSSQGIDALLDVISVNTDASAGVEIKLKGSSSLIFTDKFDGTADVAPVAILPAELAAANEQLTVLDALRTRMNSLASLYSSLSSCNGSPIDDGSACDVDTLYNSFLPYFHTNYQEDGSGRSEAVWEWICRLADDSGDAKSKAECLAAGIIYFENVSLKDITLISYDTTTDVALINFNFYEGGVLKGQAEMILKLEGSVYNLMGNLKTFKYSIDSESLHSSVYNKSTNTGTDSYSVNLKFYYEDSGVYTFNGDEVFTLTADSGHTIFPGNSASMNLYLVVAPDYSGGVCTSGLMFSTKANPYRMINQATGVESYANYATACAFTNDPCDCRPSAGANAWFDHDASQRVSISADQIALMDKSESISLSGAGVAADKFVIAKPLLVNQFNADQYIPSFGMTAANFCENVTFSTSLNLSVASGYLSYLGIHHSFSDASSTSWKNENDSQNYWDTAPVSAVYTPNFTLANAGDVINHSYLYLSARDEFEREFVRQVSCQ